MISPLLTL
nr:unnamed protein product [Callosobruchus analis]